MATEAGGAKSASMAAQEPRLCPRCHDGTVLSAVVRQTGRRIHICGECEAVWFCDESIEYATFNYFTLYMERQGLRPKWSELDVTRPGRE